MKGNFESKRKVITIGLIGITIVIVVIMAISILGNKSKNNELDGVSENTNNAINFVTTPEGIKENISKQVNEEQIIQYIVVSNAKLTYENGISKLTAQVSNRLSDEDNLKLKVTFLGNDAKMIATKKIEIGAIKKGETKGINIEINKDLANANSILYEIIK